jgi:uncharacterized protein (DUF58 family)
VFKSFHLNNIVYYIGGAAAVVFVLSYFQPALYRIGGLLLLLLLVAILIDMLLVYSKKNGIKAERIAGDRFSIGDENKVVLTLHNHYGFPVRTSLIDELPFQFQERKWMKKAKLERDKPHQLEYHLRPTTRGEYAFGNINLFVHAPLQLVKRHYIFPAEHVVKVYPSYIQMRRYQLLAVSNRLQEAGVKRIRKIGHSMEFEQIKEYVRGDDYRTINWLDYAINAALILSNVALVKQDKAGLITFEKNIDSFLLADKKPTQMNQVLENLYRQKTDFLEPDFEKLFSIIRNRVTNRSLMVLFTNFESLESLQREMTALKKIARYHLLLVVFFENTELKSLLEGKTKTLEEIYIKTIAEKFAYEKRQMVKELHKNGIPSILTTPENLTVNTINKYLELKTRMSI